MSHLVRWKQALFHADVSRWHWLAQTLVFLVRLVAAVLGKFSDEKLQLRSTSLAYTTLLSLVPVLAVTFSVLEGLGLQAEMQPMLFEALEPLGDKGEDIGRNILRYVDNLNFAVLGFMGIALLFWTVVSLLTRVEEAFNEIWHVPGVRSWSRRFSDYLSVALVGPVFIVAALGLTTLMSANDFTNQYVNVEPLERALLEMGRLTPYVLVWMAFAFSYGFLTNCHVRVVPALVGGLVASLAWNGIGQVFAQFVASSSKYSAIYSSLAAAVLFVIWINVGWLIILVGAHIAHYWQNTHLLTRDRTDARECQGYDPALALHVMALIASAFYYAKHSWTREVLASLNCFRTSKQLDRLILYLKERHLIVATSDGPEAYVPARPIERIYLSEILAAERTKGASTRLPRDVLELVDRVDDAAATTLEDKTLRDLVVAKREPLVYLTSSGAAQAVPSAQERAALEPRTTHSDSKPTMSPVVQSNARSTSFLPSWLVLVLLIGLVAVIGWSLGTSRRSLEAQKNAVDEQTQLLAQIEARHEVGIAQLSGNLEDTKKTLADMRNGLRLVTEDARVFHRDRLWEYSTLGGKLTERGMLLSIEAEAMRFGIGSANLVSEKPSSLDQVTALLTEQPELNARIEGHSDNRGREESNLELSKRRAEAVRVALIERGVSKERLVTKGLGATRPIADNATSSGRRKNRRVEIYVFEK